MSPSNTESKKRILHYCIYSFYIDFNLLEKYPLPETTSSDVCFVLRGYKGGAWLWSGAAFSLSPPGITIVPEAGRDHWY